MAVVYGKVRLCFCISILPGGDEVGVVVSGHLVLQTMRRVVAGDRPGDQAPRERVVKPAGKLGGSSHLP